MPPRRQTLQILLTLVGAVTAGCGTLKMTQADLATQVKLDFERHAQRHDFSTISPRDAVAFMVDFHRRVSYVHDRSTPYGDTLLYEYGVFDWGRGENFDLKITRQIVFEFSNPIEADDHIIQISLIFRYAPQSFKDLLIMTQWSCDLPEGMDIEKFALSSAGYQLASSMSPSNIELYSTAQ